MEDPGKQNTVKIPNGNLECDGMARILEVARNLARPMDLREMLTEVVKAACALLKAERCTVWLYDSETNEFYSEVLIGDAPIRIPADRGLVGSCASTRQVVNVPDCYADSRFDRSIDKSTGYQTRSIVSVPLIGYDDSLIGVIQVLNHIGGPFIDADIETATALAAQCAVALQRASMVEELLVKDRLEQELDVARQIQRRTWPMTMPEVAGYDIYGMSLPAGETGGDTYDIITLSQQRQMLLLADASGHGVGPALSVTQVRAMLRMCMRLGSDLQTAFKGINYQLAEDLPEDRFVTAFLGILDTDLHEIEYFSGGQGPLLHYRFAEDDVLMLKPTTLPLGILKELPKIKPEYFKMAPGDIVALLTDGLLEAERADGEQFGQDRTARVLQNYNQRSMAEVAQILHEQARVFAGSGHQEDDVTLLLIRRLTD